LTKKGIVQIGDFGIAKVLAATLAKAKTVVGTPYYLSPEIVQSQPYSLSTDVWSMGVMLYELCALRPPFDAPSLHMLSMKIIRGVYQPIPTQYTSSLKALVASCLSI
jgi:NIMA (never in mitosis gene a)-related kinase